MTKLDQYCKFKTEFKFEPYLVTIVIVTYIEIRRKFKINTNWPNLFIFRNILGNQNAIVINSVARFISESTTLRDETLSNSINDS